MNISVHFGVFSSVAFGVKAGGTKPHIQSLSLEIKPQPKRVLGGEAGRVVGWLGALQSGCSGFEPSTLAA